MTLRKRPRSQDERARRGLTTPPGAVDPTAKDPGELLGGGDEAPPPRTTRRQPSAGMATRRRRSPVPG